MKPSERRALEAEMRAQKEAEQREKLLEAKSKRQESANHGAVHNPATPSREEKMNSNAEYKKLPEEEIIVKGDGYHRESFFGRHVKLITFIICLTLIVTVIGPWGIDRMVDKGRQDIYGDEVMNKNDLSVKGVMMLAQMGETITWDTFENLNYIDYSFEKNDVLTQIREYPIEGTSLVLRVGGTATGKVTEYKITGTNIVLFRKSDMKLPETPDYVRLIDYSNGEFVDDIRKDDVAVFLSKYTD